MKRSVHREPRLLRIESLEGRRLLTAASFTDPAPVAGQVEQLFPPARTNSGSVSPGITVVEPDGAILAAGAYHGELAIARYNTDGSLDKAFGSGGLVTLQLAQLNYSVLQVQVAADGSFVVLGLDQDPLSLSVAGPGQLTVDHFSASGSLAGPTQIIGGFGANDEVIDALLQSDGKIVALTHNQTLMRFDTDGSLDTSFGGTGQVNFGSDSSYVDVQLTIGAAGHLILTADHAVYGTIPTLYVAQYNADGTLDKNFGDGGQTYLSFGQDEVVPDAVTVDGAGRIVVVGRLFGNEPNILNSFPLTVVRLTTDGKLDSSFGAGGKATITSLPPEVRAYGLLIQSDGKMVVESQFQPSTIQASGPPSGGLSIAVVSAAAPSGPAELFMARLNSNGSLDSSFGNHGVFQTTAPLGQGTGLAQQADGKLIATTTSVSLQQVGELFTSRFNTGGSLDSTFRTVPASSAGSPTSVAGPSDAVPPASPPITGTKVTQPAIVARSPVPAPTIATRPPQFVQLARISTVVTVTPQAPPTPTSTQTVIRTNVAFSLGR